VRLPDYLLRPEIVRRAGENQLEPSGVDRWAESVDRAFARVLCLDLAARLPKGTVVAFPEAASEDSAVRVEVEVTAFEGTTAGLVHLDARFTVRDPRTGSRIARESRLERAASGEGTAAVVAAMSAAIGELADAIARELAAVSARSSG